MTASRPLSLGTALLLAAAAVVLPAAGPAAASAAGPAAASAAGPAAAAPDPGQTHQVTLITGDVVQVSEIGGKTTVAVDRASSGAIKASTEHGDTYVVPERAAPYLRAGTLDRELFNVTALIEQGRADDHTARLPLIVTYDGRQSQSALSAKARALPATEPSVALPSIDGAGVTVTKAGAREFWTAVDSAPTTGDLGRGVDKIWLDGTAHATLDVSVPLIGAPTAWQHGYDGTGTKVAVLDTGADANHPDLAGRIGAQADFTGKGTAVDGHGHGTHVAATVAGSGAASGGARKGVAPGASLMIGKVLDDGGSGLDSWIIAGMEWATGNGADVVNMSLGGYASDGKDPLSLAVDDLTAQTGTLFVIAAGNDGPSGYSVTNPGTADAALTVGNVTKTEELAPTSGRGPRNGDHAIKPDITAPGTGIVAARAAGTSLGTPVDQYYTSLTGTSMATPHVAGAAAIVRQQHPDWTPAQVKAALVSTAKPRDDLTVYQQGGGRVDLARATTQGVYAGPTPLNFGYLPYPQTELGPIARTVTLTNVTGSDITLDVSASARHQDGAPAPAGMLRLSRPTVTVPANGTATVDVTVDPAAGGPGLYSGAFVGQAADGTRVSLPLGLNKEPEAYDLTVTALDRFGEPNRGATVQIGNVEDSSKYLATPNLDAQGQATVRVPPGTYSVLGVVTTIEGSKYTYTFVGEPEIEVGPGGAGVVLDGRKAVPIRADVGTRTENVSAKLEFWRMPLAGEPISFRYLLGEPFADMYAVPTKRVSKGDFHLVTQFSLVAPDIEVSGDGLPRFQPQYFIYSPELDQGRYRLPVVDAGKASPEELAAVDSRGKVALIEAENGQWSEQITAAAADGARMAFLYTRNGYPFFGAVERDLPIPGAALDVEEADALLAWLKQGGRTVDVSSTPDSPFLYDLRYDADGAVPANLVHTVRDSDVATVQSSYRADADRRSATEVNASFAPWQDFSFDANRSLRIPAERTEYVTAEPGMLWLKTVYGYESADVFSGRPMRDQLRYYDGDDRLSDTWFGVSPVPTPRQELTAQDRIAVPCTACRDGDELFLWLEDSGDGAAGHYGAFDTRWENSATRLYRDGELVVSRRTGRGVLPAVAGAADYRLEIDNFSKAPWSWGTTSKSAWTFHSAAPNRDGGLPPWYACAIDRPDRGRDCAFLTLLFARYDLPLDALNRALAGRPYHFTVSVDGQPFAPQPQVREVSLDVSYDDGATWQPAQVSRVGKSGTYEVTVRHPGSAQFVSLRLRAEDDHGNGLTQEVTRAYRLR
jgi:hypothetical protein